MDSLKELKSENECLRVLVKQDSLTGLFNLQEMAKLITYIFLKKDISGRIGGDEFAVFMPGSYKEELILSKIENLQKRLGQAGNELGIKGKLSFTAGAAFTECRDTFRQVYDRADCAMRNGKFYGKKEACFYEASLKTFMAEPVVSSGQPFSIVDMKCRPVPQGGHSSQGGLLPGSPYVFVYLPAL